MIVRKIRVWFNEMLYFCIPLKLSKRKWLESVTCTHIDASIGETKRPWFPKLRVKKCNYRRRDVLYGTSKKKSKSRWCRLTCVWIHLASLVPSICLNIVYFGVSGECFGTVPSAPVTPKQRHLRLPKLMQGCQRFAPLKPTSIQLRQVTLNGTLLPPWHNFDEWRYQRFSFSYLCNWLVCVWFLLVDLFTKLLVI